MKYFIVCFLYHVSRDTIMSPSYLLWLFCSYSFQVLAILSFNFPNGRWCTVCAKHIFYSLQTASIRFSRRLTSRQRLRASKAVTLFFFLLSVAFYPSAFKPASVLPCAWVQRLTVKIKIVKNRFLASFFPALSLLFFSVCFVPVCFQFLSFLKQLTTEFVLQSLFCLSVGCEWLHIRYTSLFLPDWPPFNGCLISREIVFTMKKTYSFPTQ